MILQTIGKEWHSIAGFVIRLKPGGQTEQRILAILEP
jgi:hypothetical protein